jgi:hypothetical protein
MVAFAPAPSGGRRNDPQLSKSDLSPNGARLVELMQGINFGRLEQIQIRNAEPVFDPEPVIVREVKFGGDNGPRPESQAEDFLLKSQVVQLFSYFKQFRNGVIDVLEIKHGLPFRMIIREGAA